MLHNWVAQYRENDFPLRPVLWVIFLAILTGVSSSVYSGTPFLIAILIVGIILVIIAPVTRAVLLLSAMILAAPYYQYRFDIPPLPFHFTLHRFLLLLAIPTVLYVVGHRRLLYATIKKKEGELLSEVIPAILWLFVWFVLEVIASIRSESAAGFARIFPRSMGILSAFLIVLLVRQHKQIRLIMKIYVFAAIIPALVGIWQMGEFIITSEFPGIPLQSFVEENLSSFQDAYKGSQFYNLPGVGIMPRFASVMVDPNYLSSYLSTAIIVAFGLFYFNNEKRSRAKKTSILGLLTIFLAVDLLTLSRSGLLGLVVGFGVLIFFHPVARRGKTAIFQIVIAMTAIYGLVLLTTSQTQGKFGMILEARLGVASFQNGALERVPYFKAGIDTFLSNPILGVGATNTLRFSSFYTAHSSPLTILAEFGMLGFIIFYGPLWRFSQFVYRVTRYKGGDDTLSQISATILAAMVSLIVATVPYDHILTLEVNWILIGIFLAASSLAQKRISAK